MPRKKIPSGQADSSSPRPGSRHPGRAKPATGRTGKSLLSGAGRAGARESAHLPTESPKEAGEQTRKERGLRAEEALIASEARYRRLFEGARRGISEGTVRFLQKPFGMDRLAREIRAALAGRPGR